MSETKYRLGIDIGSTTVKVALIDNDLKVLFSDYQRHYANIQETLASLLHDAIKVCGNAEVYAMIQVQAGLRSPYTLTFLLFRKL